MFAVIWDILAFLIAISILIGFHEFGHFIVARKLGVKVLRFSIGFGKPLFKYIGKSGTEYVIAAFPLGGYVKMLDETEGEVPEKDLDKAFNRKPLRTRVAVVVAGPIFNIIFAIFAYWLMFVVGINVIAPVIGQVKPNSIAAKAGLQPRDEFLSVNGETTASWHDVTLAFVSHLGQTSKVKVVVKNYNTGLSQTHYLNLTNWQPDVKKFRPIQSLGLTPYQPNIPPEIGKVFNNSPAAKAGFKVGDMIVSVDGHKIKDWRQLVKYVQPDMNRAVPIQVKRDGKLITLTAYPETITQDGKRIARLGIQSKSIQLPKDLIRVQRYSVFSALAPALEKTWTMISMTVVLLVKLILGKVSLATISGPVGIAQGAGISASLGFSYYLNFLALISISLGILNILPIPILDGGHLLYYLIEWIRGKPVSVEARMTGFKIGILLLLALMFIAFYNDLLRIFS